MANPNIFNRKVAIELDENKKVISLCEIKNFSTEEEYNAFEKEVANNVALKNAKVAELETQKNKMLESRLKALESFMAKESVYYSLKRFLPIYNYIAFDYFTFGNTPIEWQDDPAKQDDFIGLIEKILAKETEEDRVALIKEALDNFVELKQLYLQTYGNEEE